VDILTAGNNTALGKGWFLMETHRTQTFRWVSNDAEIYVAQLKKVKHYLQLYLEPGPGMKLGPFELFVKENDEMLAKQTIKGRQMISIELPPSEPAVHKLVLHVEAGGEVEATDARLMNFRVFKVAFFPAIIDILPPELDAQLGTGWHPLESFDGETFRWASSSPRVTIQNRGDAASLALEVEPGPGVDSKEFVLRVVDDSGGLIAKIDVKTRETVSIPIEAAAPGSPLSLTLQAEGGGKKIGSDDRVMNFRVFQYSTDLKLPGG
jgi:hypothetical protein